MEKEPVIVFETNMATGAQEKRRMCQIGLLPEAPPNGGQLIHLYFVRHALSCANITKLHALVKDPILTNQGIVESRENSCPDKFDAVLTSFLRRTMETAFYMFPEAEKIIPIPLVSELGFGFDNSPLSAAEQQRYFRQNNQKLFSKIDWTVREKYEQEAKKKKKDQSCQDVFDILEKNVIPQLLLGNQKIIANGPIHIVIVTHSNYIKECFPHLFEGKKLQLSGEQPHLFREKAGNNSMIRTSRLWDDKQQKLLPVTTTSVAAVDSIVRFGVESRDSLANDAAERCNRN